MSVTEQLITLEINRNTIRAKLVELGMATSTDRLDTLADAIANLVNRGAVSVTVKEGDTYTIPAGYHNGSGTVSGIAGGGNYNLQSKTATPTKKQQNVTPDDGYFGLSDVTVAPIPDAYQDVTSVTATAGDVLVGKIFVNAAGVVVAGTIPNNGAVSKSLDAAATSYTIPAGYHNGSGKVTITLETKTVTPTKSQQKVVPTTGKVLSEVTVEPIPSNYIDTGDADATADNILDDKTAYVDGVKVQGTMPNNGAVSKTLDTTTKAYTVPKGYHNGTGKVSITTESKSATPTKSQQKITPSTGKVLSDVTIAPIPAAYQNVSGVTAGAADVLSGKKIVSTTGAVIDGAIPVNGDVSTTIDGLNTTSCTIPAGHTTGGTVSLTNDIENALDAIVGGENSGIKNELASLAESKADIAAAIESKGVAVPSGTKLDGMAALIGQIETGGSLETFHGVITRTPATAGGGTFVYYTSKEGKAELKTSYDGTPIEIDVAKNTWIIVEASHATDLLTCTNCESNMVYEYTVLDMDFGVAHVIKVTGDNFRVDE